MGFPGESNFGGKPRSAAVAKWHGFGDQLQIHQRVATELELRSPQSGCLPPTKIGYG